MTPARPVTSADSGLAPTEVLRWCAAAAPDPWFPAALAEAAGVPRDRLDGPVWQLRQAGLIAVADWVKGRGQGFTVTPDGFRVLAGKAGGGMLRPAPAGPPAAGSEWAATPLVDPAVLAATPDGPAVRAKDPRPTVVAPALLLVCVAWFLAGAGWGGWAGRPVGPYLAGRDVAAVMDAGAVTGRALYQGEWWRLASSAFVHVGAAHLLVNMISLAAVGPVVELLWGRRRFAAIYGVSGLVGAAAAAGVHPQAATAGASGAIWGIMAALLAWLVRYPDRLPAGVARAWVRRVAVVLAVNAAVSLAPGVSWEAHFGGGAAGYAAAVLLDWARAGESGRRTALGLGLLAGLAGAAGGGLAAATYLTPGWRAIRGLDTPQLAALADAAGRRAELQSGLAAVTPDKLKAAVEAVLRASAVKAADGPAAKSAAKKVADVRAGLAAAGRGLPADLTPAGRRVRAYLLAVADLVAALHAAQAAPADRVSWAGVAATLSAANAAWAGIPAGP